MNHLLVAADAMPALHPVRRSLGGDGSLLAAKGEEADIALSANPRRGIRSPETAPKTDANNPAPYTGVSPGYPPIQARYGNRHRPQSIKGVSPGYQPIQAK